MQWTLDPKCMDLSFNLGAASGKMVKEVIVVLPVLYERDGRSQPAGPGDFLPEE